MATPAIHNAMELEALVQQMGFLPFFPCAIPNFSIEEFTPGCYWFVDGVDGPWEWRMELARRHGVPVVITINAEAMAHDGAAFYRSENGVWLCEYVAPEYFLTEGQAGKC